MRMRGCLYFWLHTLFFRFWSQSLWGSGVLVFATSNKYLAQWFVNAPLAMFVIGGLLLFNCMLIATEILVGNALMGSGYSRYCHLGFTKRWERLSPGKRRILELRHFSSLAFETLVVIASVCSSYHIIFGGFGGLYNGEADPNGEYFASQRFFLWLQFLYFATTAFSTVGFGDIYPKYVLGRLLVTMVHFLTFVYVLFLLQTLLGQSDDGQAPTPESKTS